MAKQKTGLGKGLSALIRSSAPVERAPAGPGATAVEDRGDGRIDHIAVSQIRPNPFQPRADFDQQALDELKASIKQKGIIQAVTVRRTSPGVYQLISGERRIRAATELGLATIPAYIMDVKADEDMLELALIENLQREHLNPIEIAISYQRLIRDVGQTAEDVARKVSKDRTTVVNFLRLLKLPEKIQFALRKGELTMGHARALVAIPDEHVQLKLFDRIMKKGLNVRQVETLVRDISKKPEARASKPRRANDSGIGSIEERIQQILGTRVKIITKEGGKGEIVAEFYSADDLDRLFDLFLTIKG
jgi:ParB family chromosome partitioning protein